MGSAALVMDFVVTCPLGVELLRLAAKRKETR